MTSPLNRNRLKSYVLGHIAAKMDSFSSCDNATTKESRASVVGMIKYDTLWYVGKICQPEVI